jgi:probable intron-encoded endonuclease aI5
MMKNIGKTHFDFSEFTGAFSKEISISFLEWFVGFSEGDGSFVMNSRGNVTFVITQSIKNVETLFKIKEKLCFGKVIKQGITTYRYIVSKKHDIHMLIFLFNGNLVIPSKKKDFVRWVNKYNIHNNMSIEVKNNEIFPSTNDAWLCGFTDAEGCFTCSLLNNSTAYRYRYILAQKGVENKVVLNSIRNFLGGTVSSMFAENVYQLTVNGIKNNTKVITYFDKYTLQTNKEKSYFLWKDVGYSIINKEHLNKISRENLKKKVSVINK